MVRYNSAAALMGGKVGDADGGVRDIEAPTGASARGNRAPGGGRKKGVGPGWTMRVMILLVLIQASVIGLLFVLYMRSSFRAANEELELESTLLHVPGSLPPAIANLALHDFDAKRFFHPSVCNGLTHQKLDILYAALLTQRAGAVLVIPQLVKDGAQVDDAPRTANEPGNALHFEEMFDGLTLFKSLQEEGVQFTTRELLEQHFGPNYEKEELECSDQEPCWKTLADATAPHMHMTCPFPSTMTSPDDIVEHQERVFRLLNAMTPSRQLAGLIMHAKKALAQTMEGAESIGDYNFLHARIEHDWELHCKRWEPFGDNCMNNTSSLPQQLIDKKVDSMMPLYVGADWQQFSPRQLDTVEALARNGYVLVNQVDVLPTGVETLAREAAALIDFEIGMGAQKTIGNSVSIFDALMLMLRWNTGRWASYYNGGFIPLEAFMPLFAMPVVYSYHPSTDLAYSDYMMKALVKSALEVGRVKLFCLFQGAADDEHIKWSQAQGVTIIRHQPLWGPAMAALAPAAKENEGLSPLFANAETILSTMARLDIPVIDELLQYNFVLYTDIDVFFRRHVNLLSFGQNLTKAVGMAPERFNMFPYNAGISLWNTLELRRSHEQLIAFTLSVDKLWFQKGSQIYGPLDQGAINQFYEADVRAWVLPSKFNAMPYKDSIPDAAIVHFHGPKLHDYVKWKNSVQNNGYDCHFWDFCELGMTHSLCTYMEDYKQWVQGTQGEEFISALECHPPDHSKQ